MHGHRADQQHGGDTASGRGPDEGGHRGQSQRPPAESQVEDGRPAGQGAGLRDHGALGG
ncbi:hypothetical protein AB1484_05160 [Parafrankia sp. FMc6]|uniref:hypothetical protein n=1 Tax=Parafrankia soli TaxID=2599596 RepID=UPI0034D44535